MRAAAVGSGRAESASTRAAKQSDRSASRRPLWPIAVGVPEVGIVVRLLVLGGRRELAGRDIEMGDPYMTEPIGPVGAIVPIAKVAARARDPIAAPVELDISHCLGCCLHFDEGLRVDQYRGVLALAVGRCIRIADRVRQPRVRAGRHGRCGVDLPSRRIQRDTIGPTGALHDRRVASHNGRRAGDGVGNGHVLDRTPLGLVPATALPAIGNVATEDTTVMASGAVPQSVGFAASQIV